MHYWGKGEGQFKNQAGPVRPPLLSCSAPFSLCSYSAVAPLRMHQKQDPKKNYGKGKGGETPPPPQNPRWLVLNGCSQQEKLEQGWVHTGNFLFAQYRASVKRTAVCSSKAPGHLGKDNTSRKKKLINCPYGYTDWQEQWFWERLQDPDQIQTCCRLKGQENRYIHTA